jgi:hypothetical protein
MSTDQTNPNTVAPSQTARNLIEQYIVTSPQKDWSSEQWTNFKKDWFKFNQVWAYNYTVSTLNASLPAKSQYARYQFLTYDEKASYVKGQTYHVIGYPTQAAAGAFNNI